LSEKIACDHCHLEFDKGAMINDGDHHFCCKGCQGVFHLLQDEGLDSFYDRMGSATLAPPTETLEDSSKFDSPAFQAQYVKTKNEQSEIALVLEGIHCSACVWLNEKVLHNQEGVIEASINFSTHKAKIIYDPSKVKLSTIIDTIRSIGYDAHPYDVRAGESRIAKERKDYYMRMAVAIFATMNVMWIAVAQYAGYFTGMEQSVKTILNVAEWVLATPVLFYSGWIFFRGAYFGIKNHVVNMDLLVATGALLTYGYSIIITVMEWGEAYFDSVTMIITFVLIGKFLEVLSKKSASDTLDMMSKQMPLEVNVVDGKQRIAKAVQSVEVGETIEVKQGEKVALDGVITYGSAHFDESNLMGESLPVYKSRDQHVVSGTHLTDGLVHFKVLKDFSHSTLNVIVELLENALTKKPRIEQRANELSEHFSTTILLLSALTFLGWLFYVGAGFNEAFLVGISVIVIACPCALALATPLATLIGVSLGMKRGILFKEASFIETLAKVDTLVLDKTGTITQGKPQVIDVKEHQPFETSWLLALVQTSNHPIAKGIVSYLGDQSRVTLENVKTIQARGMEATYENNHLLGGSAKLMREVGIDVEDGHDSGFYFAINGTLVAHYILQDEPKEDAKEVIELFKANNIDVIMLTGDHEQAAFRIANQVGIETVEHSLTPQAKHDYIAMLQNSGKKVVMVGDGVNDLLALARAEIAIAMGSGADVSVEVSDVVLLDDSLNALKEALLISQTTYKLIKQNLTLSLVYNAVTIPLAIAGYIIPLIAALSMSFSSLLVVANSMRIKYSWRSS
jgi:Cu+-exporting ATPase